ncbi:torsin-1A-interacting protein 2-like [Limanda limanda]|uniref:torsin-1A-interacting protein 2-like n=1 Tax=Limanda limanda TaxID=27771 RepID=UPI0029C6A19A|nr:torsin-1A-interacting protein 2-like [Limanda limanda]XP_060933506.1 torsin-1A-interacting protein 2-like [Limanda limanda]
MAETETETSRQLRSATDTEKPKGDTNSLPVVNRENNIVKEELDDNITKPAATTNEEAEDDTNEPANKEPTVQADDKREDLTEKNGPDTTSSPALDPVNGDQLHGFTGGPDLHPQQDQDEPKDDTSSLHQENNIVKEDLNDNITKPAAPTNEEAEDDTNEPTNKEPTVQADDKREGLTEKKAPDTTSSPALDPVNSDLSGDTGELTAPADVKREDFTEEKAPVTTSSPAPDPVNADQSDGPDVRPQQDEDIQNEAAGDHERSPEHDSPELERLHTKEEMHNQRIPVETIKSVSLESVERTATDYIGILRGNLWVLTAVAVVVVAVLLGIYLIPSSPPETPRDESKVDNFLRQMEKVKAQFPNQRAELWKRSRIHLLRHLQTAHPTAPVSLILTAGLRAEKTMHCLAQRLASSLSSALNASYLHIDGSSAAGQDSDQVKLDIDRRLQSGFEGDTPVAIIHRFEELPPGSTLIFYRYCDHENAAYKETFLIFTVLLEEEEEIHAKLHLNAVEEMVDDHLKKKFLSDDHPVSFDRMDIDKYGGLWSRISHLILPVAAEHRIEYKGCQG